MGSRHLSLARSCLRLSLAAFLLCPISLPAQQQPRALTITGRVTLADGTAGRKATIEAQSLPGRVTRRLDTDSAGGFSIAFPLGAKQVNLTAIAFGMLPEQITVDVPDSATVLSVNIRLRAAVTTIAGVTVKAERKIPSADDRLERDASGSDRNVAGVLSPAEQGNLSAMASSVPGIRTVGGGFSVLGLPPDQNRINLDGTAVPLRSIPRGAAVFSRVTTSAFDPSTGGFSGGQLSLNTLGGSNLSERGVQASLDHPVLEAEDKTRLLAEPEFSQIDLSAQAAGALAPDKAFYNIAGQFGRTTTLARSLFMAPPEALRQSGVDAADIAALQQALLIQGVPLGIETQSGVATTLSGSVLGRSDLVLSDSHTLRILAAGEGIASNRESISPIAVSTAETKASRYSGLVQFTDSRIWHGIVLNEFGLSAIFERSTSQPVTNLPRGRVWLRESSSPDSREPLFLTFGGSAGAFNEHRTNGLEARNQSTWFSPRNSHRFDLTLLGRYTDLRSRTGQDLLGTFTYESLTQLESGVPLLFTRDLGLRTANAAHIETAASLGDRWKISERAQIQLGFRLDASAVTTQSHLLSPSGSQFQEAVGTLPKAFTLSPRLGFRTTYGTAKSKGETIGSPIGSIRGGIGVFASILQPTLAIPALESQTGDGLIQLQCFGEEAPAADWPAYRDRAAIPNVCTGTVSPGPSALPKLVVFDKDFRPARSLRANLAWAGPFGGRLRASAELIYSFNDHQPSITDLNFDSVPQFVLREEMNRPVFVAPDDITSEGRITSRPRSLDPTFGPIQQIRSDVKSRSGLLTVGIHPKAVSSSSSWFVFYALGLAKSSERGFSGSTAGNPLDLSWGTSDADARHQFTAIGYRPVGDNATLDYFLQLNSGFPFTPVVGGDINGDGFINDRALVGWSGSAGDSTQSEQMDSLLGTAPERVKKCLRRQLGTIARRNSCRAGWSSRSVVTVNLQRGSLGLPRRAHATLTISNPISGIDRLIHRGSPHGWGEGSPPDPILLTPRAFDRTRARFTYDVNPNFGRPERFRSGNRDPLRLTLSVQIDLGPDPQKQQMRQLLTPGRNGPGSRLPAAVIKARYARSILNPVSVILQLRDSLQLTKAQVDTLIVTNDQFVIASDTVWGSLATFLESQPERYDLSQAVRHAEMARDSVLRMLVPVGYVVKRILTSEQLRLLPWVVNTLLDEKALEKYRRGVGDVRIISG